jgi:hypothetical protein
LLSSQNTPQNARATTHQVLQITYVDILVSYIIKHGPLLLKHALNSDLTCKTQVEDLKEQTNPHLLHQNQTLPINTNRLKKNPTGNIPPSTPHPPPPKKKKNTDQVILCPSVKPVGVSK